MTVWGSNITRKAIHALVYRVKSTEGLNLALQAEREVNAYGEYAGGKILADLTAASV